MTGGTRAGRRQYEASVIIPTYNREELLGYTLESLARQDAAPGSFEVLVCDDGSSDGSEAVVRAFADRLPIRWFHQEDRGYRVAMARNLGIRNAAGRICVFVDSGVLAGSGFVRAHLEAHPRGAPPGAALGYVYGFDMQDAAGHPLLERIDPAAPDSSLAYLRASGSFLDLREKCYLEFDAGLGGLPAPWVYFWTCNASAPREAILAAGAFDERYVTWGMEDLDLGYRLFRGGCGFVLARSAEAIHFPHARDNEGNRRSNTGNKEYFARKFRDFPSEAILHCPAHRLNAMLRAFLAAYRGSPRTSADCAAGDMAAEDVLIIGAARLAALPDPRSICLEPDPAAADALRARYPNATVLNLLGLELPFPDKRFRAAVIAGFADCIPAEWRDRFDAETARVADLRIDLRKGES